MKSDVRSDRPRWLIRSAWLLGATLLAATLLLVAAHLWPKQPLAAAVPRSTAIRARHGELLRLTLASDGQYRLWVPLEDMPPRLADAVLLYEDHWFYRHPGFNPIALARAAVNNMGSARRIGASTLSMQLARRLYSIDTRSVGGKLCQMAGALWLEARYSKHDILEAYLNLAPYGRNVEGAGAASWVYFGQPAARLTAAQVMTLAVIPQNPQARRLSRADPQRQLARDEARARLWTAWLKTHPEDAVYTGDMNASLDARGPESLPFIAPHLTDALIRQYKGDVHSTLDLKTQRTVEGMLHHYVAQNSAVGITNAAALLVEVGTNTAKVRAYVGSANYFDATIDGQVNAITAKRSPGSLLKPFVYALALDQGLLHPRTMLKDAPSSFGPFSPENFDGRFVGPIAAEDALIRSRNVPAVEVASHLSRPNLYDFLASSGVSRLNPERYYGLALTLGGGELSIEELARMYATLNNGGRLPTLECTEREPNASASPTQLLSPEASFITLSMLAKNPRPDTGQPAAPSVAWKTGTSWGFHDAWSAAVLGRYVLIVWIGNFDNSQNPAFVGIQAAAPLLFRTVDALRNQALLDEGPAARPPATVARVDVCLASGDLPNSACPQTTSTWYIPGKSPIRESTLHRRVYLDAGGRRVCQPGPGIHEQVFEFWSSDMLKLFSEAGLPRRIPPPAPECAIMSASDAHDAPQITSPLRGVTYTLRTGKSAPLALRATTDAESRAIYWFADNSFIGSASISEPLAWQPPTTGHYVLRAVDEYGGADSRDVDVALMP